jgi:hypothetical protein
LRRNFSPFKHADRLIKKEDVMKAPTSRLSRRNFLLAAGAGGMATAAAIAGKNPQAPAKKSEAVSGSRGYHLTEHIRKYYSTTKV